jgi:pimeloyl-ACP methyl ester carboxylesterase
MLHTKKFIHSSSSKWVVFIHGAGGSSAVWFKQIKPFSEKFNVLLLDLRGHGQSKLKTDSKNYSFKIIANDVLLTMQEHAIETAHFVGVSMGSIIIKQLYSLSPKTVQSMVFAGAVTKLNFKSRLLLRIGRIFNSIMPYMLLYKIFARVMMPRKNHEQSRKLFIKEAKKLMDKEFRRWFKLTAQLTAYLAELEQNTYKIPTLYIMGGEDNLFLTPVKKLLQNDRYSQLQIVPNCGHVVNIENSIVFNELSINFIERQKIGLS